MPNSMFSCSYFLLFPVLELCTDPSIFSYFWEAQIAAVYEMGYINKLALPCLVLLCVCWCVCVDLFVCAMQEVSPWVCLSVLLCMCVSVLIYLSVSLSVCSPIFFITVYIWISVDEIFKYLLTRYLNLSLTHTHTHNSHTMLLCVQRKLCFT